MVHRAHPAGGILFMVAGVCTLALIALPILSPANENLTPLANFAGRIVAVILLLGLGLAAFAGGYSWWMPRVVVTPLALSLIGSWSRSVIAWHLVEHWRVYAQKGGDDAGRRRAQFHVRGGAEPIVVTEEEVSLHGFDAFLAEVRASAPGKERWFDPVELPLPSPTASSQPQPGVAFFRPHRGWLILTAIGILPMLFGGSGMLTAWLSGSRDLCSYACLFFVYALGMAFTLFGINSLGSHVLVHAHGISLSHWFGIAVYENYWQDLKSWTQTKNEDVNRVTHIEFEFTQSMGRVSVDEYTVAVPGMAAFLDAIRARVGEKEVVIHPEVPDIRKPGS